MSVYDTATGSKTGDRAAWLLIVTTVAYFGGHVVAAIVRGSIG